MDSRLSMRGGSFYRDADSSVSSVDLESSFGDTDYEFENSPSVDMSRRTVSELYQRLDSLRSIHDGSLRYFHCFTRSLRDDASRHVIARRRTILSKECDTFAGIRPQRSSAFDIYLMNFSSDDVICVDIHCISYNIQHEDGGDAPKLRVSLHLNTSSKGLYPLNAKPEYHRGVYSFALTTADVSSGEYQLLLMNEGDSAQNVRISYRVKRVVRAAPLEIGKTVKGSVELNQVQYYRVVGPVDTSKLLTFRVQPDTDAAGKFIGDPDLFVCNSHGGLVEVTRESASWSSITTGVEVVHIHPEDPSAKRGRVFIIGIIGARDSSLFTLDVATTSPPPILRMSPNVFDELRTSASRPAYFCVDVNPTPGFTYIFVGLKRESLVKSIDSRQFPRSGGLICTTEDPRSVAAILGLPSNKRDQQDCMILVYASLSNMYPDIESYSWRV